MRWLALSVLAGAAMVGGYTLQRSPHRSTVSKTALIDTLRAKIEHDRALALQPLDCHAIDTADYGGQSVCYGSNQDTQQLVGTLGSALELIGFTPGWRED